eukprot:7925763-Ditylum_brightwellii.AAC.2
MCDQKKNNEGDSKEKKVAGYLHLTTTDETHNFISEDDLLNNDMNNWVQLTWWLHVPADWHRDTQALQTSSPEESRFLG